MIALSTWPTRQKFHISLLIIFIFLMIWSAINPRYPLEWVVEVIPLVIAVAIITFTYKKFTFSSLSYVFMFLFAILLLIGAHYSYESVPFFNTIYKSIIGSERNDFDRLIHLFEGIIPALMAREIFIRKGIITKRFWLFFLSLSVALSLSAAFELVEWAVTITFGVDAIGGQGEIYDTQIDMLLALVGGATALLIFRIYQNKILKPFYGKL